MSGWTSSDLPDQTGRRVVVTGANSGIGYQAALELARKGASVVLAVRDPDGRGRESAERIVAAAPGAEVDVRRLDLADLATVRAFAAEWDGPLDLLVNNAGVMALPRQLTADGFERQIGTNHLGHFALTGLLLPALLRTAAPRVVTVSSNAHKIGKMDFDDLMGERRYRRWAQYGQAKLANLLFAFELQRRADAARAPLTSVACHPGYASTNLQSQHARATDSKADAAVNRVLNLLFAQSEAAGAWPTLYAATQDLPGGTYVGPGGPAEFRGHPKIVTGTKAAYDLESARRLWEISEGLTGVTYVFGEVGAPA
jgi:NAD(P)-dependent dehydrogenase (short-subunit alcohol dehydrogenase family)